jgi:hypothetical protein
MVELTSGNCSRSRQRDSVILRSQQFITLILDKAIGSWMGLGEMVNVFTMMFLLLIFDFNTALRWIQEAFFDILVLWFQKPLKVIL